MAMRPQVKFALAAAGAAAAVGLGVWGWLAFQPKPKKKHGSLLCPAQAGRKAVPAETVGRGDFVVVQLQSADGKFHESTWATVLGETGDVLAVMLAGEQVEEGIRPLATDQHGFRLGDRMTLARDCIWELFRPEAFDGTILCGPQITELGEQVGEDLFAVAAGLTVQRGDRARILVASKEAQGSVWHEEIWTRIATISPTGQVITALVDEDPEEIERHKLTRGSVVRFNRDCVIGV